MDASTHVTSILSIKLQHLPENRLRRETASRAVQIDNTRFQNWKILPYLFNIKHSGVLLANALRYDSLLALLIPSLPDNATSDKSYPNKTNDIGISNGDTS